MTAGDAGFTDLDGVDEVAVVRPVGEDDGDGDASRVAGGDRE